MSGYSRISDLAGREAATRSPELSVSYGGDLQHRSLPTGFASSQFFLGTGRRQFFSKVLARRPHFRQEINAPVSMKNHFPEALGGTTPFGGIVGIFRTCWGIIADRIG